MSPKFTFQPIYVSVKVCSLETRTKSISCETHQSPIGVWTPVRDTDNVFIERLWRSLRHEDIYLKGYADGCEAKAGIAAWVEFYNDQRLHQALGYRTPMAVWRGATADACAVDMMDNAVALPTCPQQRQQTKPLAA